MRIRLLPILLATGLAASGSAAQTVLERSPNVQGVWGLPPGDLAFVLSHRFEIQSGGDELSSFPTLTLALGLPMSLTAGLDYTSYSEVIPGNVTGNETQYWLKRGLGITSPLRAAGLVGYNTAASSAEAALDLSYAVDRLSLFAEGRGHSDLFGAGSAALSGTIGAAVRLNRYVAITGDLGRVLTEDGIPAAWSGALALEIPATPHSLSFQIANSGAMTLQGASREKTVGESDVRYGFSFTVPLGSRSRWARLIRPFQPPVSAADTAAATVNLSNLSFVPAEARIRAGEAVEWINIDPLIHTVTAEGDAWDSGALAEGERYRRAFTEPGRYSYYCIPHPTMRGVVIVDP
ncbi:MAG: cupredoxin family copper-binding protein [Gemmatimonadota bacterium]